MALKSTIFKATLSVADIDHNYYANHILVLARHPSETDERMMVRLLALALNAHKVQTVCNGDGTISFGAGLSDPDDPDVFLKDYTGQTRLWIEVGQPEEKPIAKACQKADEVRVYAFSQSADVWWRGIESKLRHMNKLQVWRIPLDAFGVLSEMTQRGMQLQATIQDGAISLSDNRLHIQIECKQLK
jgi:uncharacterized protein YaeQ